MGNNNRFTLIAVGLIVVLGFAVYANSLGGKFLLDDNAFIVNNVHIKSWQNIPKLFTRDVAAGAGDIFGFYRPVQMLSFMTDYSVWGLKETGYHLTNIVLQILVALSIYWFVTILFGDRLLSLLTALFFVIHPVHTEVVSYIAGRVDSLPFLFMMLAFIFYIKQLTSKNTILYILMILVYILSVLSKESSLILPLLILLYHYTFKKKIDLKLFLPIFGIACFYFVLRFAVLRSLPMDKVVLTEFFSRMPGTFFALTNYLRLLIFPFNLHHDYGKAFFRFLEPASFLGVVIFFSLLVYAFKKRESNKLVFFSIAWFFISLLPVSNIYPLHTYMAERWLYIPSIGFFLILAKCLSSLYRTERFKILSISVAVGLVFYFSGITINQNSYWKEPIDFYQRTLKYVPYSLKARNNLANIYIARGKFDEAIALYEEAIKIDPNYEDAYVNLGNVYGVIGKYEDAINMYKKAIEIQPHDEKAWYNMGNVYGFLGERDEAIRSYEKAIKLNPRYGKAYNKLGMIYTGMGRIEAAEALFKRAIELDPYDSWSYNSLGIIYSNTARKEEAIASFKKAIKIDPDFATAHNNLAVMYYYGEQYDLALKHANKAIELGYKVNPELVKSIKQNLKSPKQNQVLK